MDSLQAILDRGQDIVFFGGAGISTESGIPDFRSSAGLYATATPDSPAPEYLLSHECLEHDPESFFDFHRTSLLHPKARPNRAHQALARLEEVGKLSAVITQNIDGLHQAAGSRRVLELHGSAQRNRCIDCGQVQDMRFMLDSTGVPRCPICRGMVRPDVVLYGEPLDQRVMDAAIEAILACDVLIVGGTSLNVYPAAGLVNFYQGRDLVLINRDPTAHDGQASLVLHQDLGPTLGDAVDSLLG
ncbi:NAD-dependent protein deacylase [Luteococcus sp. Sow4_B9]|uniref:NAD-dependent protein deacylase n=1 Tax=Luteococcus sp. Sow4_B9 TaxID=3438792 RepID=UPI003F9AF6F5